MKKVFTLFVLFVAAMAVNAATIEKDLELAGSNVTLPPVYVTGRAEFQNYKRWGEVKFFDVQQSTGADPYEVYPDEWPVLHLEFEKLVDNMQIHVMSDLGEKYFNLDATQTSFDIDLVEANLVVDGPISYIGLQSKENQTENVVITKCVLTTTDGDDELPLYYVNNNSSGWGVKVVGEAKCLSGKVDFLKRYAFLGGTSWCNASDLADATNVIYTITFNEPVPSDNYQVIIKNDESKEYYYDGFIGTGTTVVTLNLKEIIESRPTYSPAAPNKISEVKIQMKAIEGDVNAVSGDYVETLDVKSVKLTVEKEGAVDGISMVNTSAEKKDGAIYNIAGQRVTKANNGIFIQNGRKYIAK